MNRHAPHPKKVNYHRRRVPLVDGAYAALNKKRQNRTLSVGIRMAPSALVCIQDTYMYIHPLYIQPLFMPVIVTLRVEVGYGRPFLTTYVMHVFL